MPQKKSAQKKLRKDFENIAQEFRSGKTFVAFDTETTGLNKESDFIIEIGAVKFNCNGTIGEPFDALVKPPVEIPPFVENLTKITNQMIQDSPDAKKVLPRFLEFVGSDDTVFVAHNAYFDMGFLNSELQRNGFTPVKNLFADTLKMSVFFYPSLKLCEEKGQYKLQNLAKRFQIQVHSAHRASDDARVCMELFKRIVSDAENIKK